MGVADRPGVAAGIFGPLADGSVNVDMIVQNISADGTTDMTFTVAEADLDRSIAILEEVRSAVAYDRLVADQGVVKVSVIGVGMRSHAGVAQTMFAAARREGHQHPGDLDLGDQDQRTGLGGLYRARRARPPRGLRTGRPVSPDAGAIPRAVND